MTTRRTTELVAWGLPPEDPSTTMGHLRSERFHKRHGPFLVTLASFTACDEDHAIRRILTTKDDEDEHPWATPVWISPKRLDAQLTGSMATAFEALTGRDAETFLRDFRTLSRQGFEFFLKRTGGEEHDAVRTAEEAFHRLFRWIQQGSIGERFTDGFRVRWTRSGHEAWDDRDPEWNLTTKSIIGPEPLSAILWEGRTGFGPMGRVDLQNGTTIGDLVIPEEEGKKAHRD